jgi:arsenate reductase-like glutaredoxin family protein
MPAATTRIPVLVTPSEKEEIARMAKAAGVSMGEYLRRAAASYRTAEDEHMLDGMIEQMIKTTAAAAEAIDNALRFVAASDKRIETMEAQAKGGNV